MKKFLFTLLLSIYSIFISEIIFAKETSEINNIITIEIAPNTKSSLIKIKNDFQTDVLNYICSQTNKESKTKVINTPSSCNPNETISDLYKCVCEDENQLYGKMKPITNFANLDESDTLNNQFKQIQEYYNALDYLALTGEIKKEIETTLNALETDKQTQIALKKEEIQSKITELNDLLNKEYDLRNDSKIKALLSDLGLEKHLEEIENEMSKNEIDFKKLLEEKYNNLPNDIEKLNDISKELTKEIEKTEKNIATLNNAINKTKEEEIKKKKEELKKAKQEESDLLKEVIALLNPSITPLKVEIKDGNDEKENNALNDKLSYMTIKPDIVFSTHNTIKEEENPNVIKELDIEKNNTQNNIETLKKLKNELEERNKIRGNLNTCAQNIDKITNKLNISKLLKTGIPPKHNKYPNGYIYLTQSTIAENCASNDRPVFYIEKGKSFDCATSKFLYPTEPEYLKTFASNLCKTCKNPKIMTIDEAYEKQQICYDNLELLKLLDEIMSNCKDSNDKYLIEPSKAITTYNSLEEIENYCKNKKEELSKEMEKNIEKEISNLSKICCDGSKFKKYCEEEGVLKNSSTSKLRTIKANELPTLTKLIENKEIKTLSCDKIDNLYDTISTSINIDKATNCEAKKDAISKLTTHNLSKKSYDYYQLKFSICE